MGTLPQIENSAQITPEAFKQYVQYVADMRLNQNRWFNTHNYDALRISKEMEKNIDCFNQRILDINPTLFG